MKTYITILLAFSFLNCFAQTKLDLMEKELAQKRELGKAICNLSIRYVINDMKKEADSTGVICQQYHIEIAALEVELVKEKQRIENGVTLDKTSAIKFTNGSVFQKPYSSIGTSSNAVNHYYPVMISIDGQKSMYIEADYNNPDSIIAIVGDTMKLVGMLSNSLKEVYEQRQKQYEDLREVMTTSVAYTNLVPDNIYKKGKQGCKWREYCNALHKLGYKTYGTKTVKPNCK